MLQRNDLAGSCGQIRAKRVITVDRLKREVADHRPCPWYEQLVMIQEPQRGRRELISSSSRLQETHSERDGLRLMLGRDPVAVPMRVSDRCNLTPERGQLTRCASLPAVSQLMRQRVTKLSLAADTPWIQSEGVAPSDVLTQPSCSLTPKADQANGRTRAPE